MNNENEYNNYDEGLDNNSYYNRELSTSYDESRDSYYNENSDESYINESESIDTRNDDNDEIVVSLNDEEEAIIEPIRDAETRDISNGVSLGNRRYDPKSFNNNPLTHPVSTKKGVFGMFRGNGGRACIVVLGAIVAIGGIIFLVSRFK